MSAPVMTPSGGTRSEGRVGFVEAVRRANAPPPPEHSITFRLATLVTVLTGIAACANVGELSLTAAIAASVAVAAGMLFSTLTRSHPWGWLKVALAVAVLGVFVDFVLQVFNAAHSGELSSIEVPLAGLFTWVQVVHAFDVPARRDLLFSVAAGAALLTVGAAQAVSAGFLVYVGLWLLASTVALACSWRSMAGGAGRLPAGTMAAATVMVVVLAVVFEAVLPPPRASQAITLPNAVTSYLPLPAGGGLTQGGANPTEPAKAGSPGGPTRVGGFVGFAGPLDTGIRAQLGNEIVLRVRADRPGYFLGQTYDRWDGQSWLQDTSGCVTRTIGNGSPFSVGTGGGAGSGALVPGSSNIQTFYVEQSLPNLLFATSRPEEVYFPDRSLVLGCDHSIRSTIAMTPGTVYTVISADDEVPPSLLLADHESRVGWNVSFARDLRLPHRYLRVAALARAIVRHATNHTVAGTVQALEAWIGSHTKYSTDIPLLLAGQDAVNQFLFGSRLGYCEQISTALAVMLRTLGIPAREATGYVPGSLNPLSDLYEIKASDAHAWVQAYTGARYGWQSFDPTAFVPLSPSSPGTVLLHDIAHELASLPWAPLSGGVLAVMTAFVATTVARRRRLRPPTPAGRLVLRLERIGRRARLARGPAETLAEYGARLEAHIPRAAPAASSRADPYSVRHLATDRLPKLAWAIARLQRAAYSPRPPRGDPDAPAISPSDLATIGQAFDGIERTLATGPLRRAHVMLSQAARRRSGLRRSGAPPPRGTGHGARRASGTS